MAERFVVLQAAVIGTAYDTIEDAERAASGMVDKDRIVRVIARQVGEVRPRQAPNVDVVRMEASS